MRAKQKKSPRIFISLKPAEHESHAEIRGDEGEKGQGHQGVERGRAAQGGDRSGVEGEGIEQPDARREGAETAEKEGGEFLHACLVFEG